MNLPSSSLSGACSTPSVQPRTVLIVTGMSGAGKTSVMRALEDVGFYCVDNLPVPLIHTFLEVASHTQSNPQNIALGIDARGEQFLPQLLTELDALVATPAYVTKMLFLHAATETLLRRFQETRRKHPLARPAISLSQAIEKEAQLLSPLAKRADMQLDTNQFNPHQLREWVRSAFGHLQQQVLVVNLMSFGFKYGVPADSNLVYDIRFLPNPHFVDQLRPLDGRNEAVSDYVFAHQGATEYWSRLVDFLRYSLEQFYREGRFFVTVAIGCTGGKHRSVCFVHRLAQQQWPQVQFLVTHRDVGRE